jgi:hypothetical protein
MYQTTLVVLWNCGTEGHLAANCNRGKPLKKQRKLALSLGNTEVNAKPLSPDSNNIIQLTADSQEDQITVDQASLEQVSSTTESNVENISSEDSGYDLNINS